MDRINRYYEMTGISAAELCRRTGLCPSSVSAYANGKATPNMSALRKLVEGTGIRADWWMGLVG